MSNDTHTVCPRATLFGMVRWHGRWIRECDIISRVFCARLAEWDSKLRNETGKTFPPVVHLTTPLRGSLGFCNSGRAQSTKSDAPTRPSKSDISIRLDTDTLDGPIDGRTELTTISLSVCIVCWRGIKTSSHIAKKAWNHICSVV